MEALRGTPVLAVQDGLAEFKQTSLGGNSIWLVTATGERYFYAHLDAFEGASRAVEAGEVIGYVGQTGNARGDHLHFEVRLGETAVNPYPYVLTACTIPVVPPAAPLSATTVAMRMATPAPTTIPTWLGDVR